MAIEVRIPTILRTYTGGEKAVEGDGRDARRAGRRPRGEPPRDQGAAGRGHGELRRFVNVYVNDEDVRFTGGLDTELNDGDAVVDPARPSPAAD